MTFRCDMCGECCRRHDVMRDVIQEIADLDRGDGVCVHLVGSLCEIYDERPYFCRVDEGYERMFRNAMSKEEFYAICYAECEKLKARPRGLK